MMRTWATVALVGLVTACGTTSSHARAKKTVPSECTGSDCESSAPKRTSYRKVERTTDPEPEPDPAASFENFEPFDPTVASARLEGEAVSSALTDAAADVEQPLAVFRGNFATSSGDEVLVVGQTTVDVRSADGKRIARREVGAIVPDTARAVRLVDDRLEVVLQRKPKDEPTIETVVLRVIGRAVAEVFVYDGDREVTFIRRGEQKAIRVSHEEGEPSTYLWNHWEGVFRIPRRAPTAPPPGR
jgi:hypothetical protein